MFQNEWVFQPINLVNVISNHFINILQNLILPQKHYNVNERFYENGKEKGIKYLKRNKINEACLKLFIFQSFI